MLDQESKRLARIYQLNQIQVYPLLEHASSYLNGIRGLLMQSTSLVLQLGTALIPDQEVLNPLDHIAQTGFGRHLNKLRM